MSEELNYKESLEKEVSHLELELNKAKELKIKNDIKIEQLTGATIALKTALIKYNELNGTQYTKDN